MFINNGIHVHYNHDDQRLSLFRLTQLWLIIIIIIWIIITITIIMSNWWQTFASSILFIINIIIIFILNLLNFFSKKKVIFLLELRNYIDHWHTHYWQMNVNITETLTIFTLFDDDNGDPHWLRWTFRMMIPVPLFETFKFKKKFCVHCSHYSLNKLR